jgi:hypothetical protein
MPDEEAIYRCDCGETIHFEQQEFSNLRWLQRKFGFQDSETAVAHQADCCQHPEYNRLTLFSDAMGGDD